MSEIEILSFGTRDATICGVSLILGGEAWHADGTSKRNPLDEDNEEIATLLATGRALELLSQKLLRRANGLVKHQDDMREYKQVQKKRAKKQVKKSKKRELILT